MQPESSFLGYQLVLTASATRRTELVDDYNPGRHAGIIGLPGAGVSYGYGCIHNLGFGGRRIPTFKIAAFGAEIGERATAPVYSRSTYHRHAGEPGATYRYNGHRLAYPVLTWCTGQAAIRFTTTRT